MGVIKGDARSLDYLKLWGYVAFPKCRIKLTRPWKMIWKLGLYSGRYRESGFQQSGIPSREEYSFFGFDVESPCL